MMKSVYPPSVVTKAFTWAYQELGLSQEQASELLGVSENALAQTLLLGFESGTPEYRTQLAFIRMYHLLIGLSEGDSDTMRAWFHEFQMPINAAPVDLCLMEDGIEQLSHFLRELRQDAMTTSPYPPTQTLATSAVRPQMAH